MPQFQVGDRVRCLHTHNNGAGVPHFVAGDIYTISAINLHSVSVERDARGQPNGWVPEFFELSARFSVPMQEITLYTIIWKRFADGLIHSRGFPNAGDLNNWVEDTLPHLGTELARKKIKTNIPVVEN